MSNFLTVKLLNYQKFVYNVRKVDSNNQISVFSLVCTHDLSNLTSVKLLHNTSCLLICFKLIFGYYIQIFDSLVTCVKTVNFV